MDFSKVYCGRNCSIVDKPAYKISKSRDQDEEQADDIWLTRSEIEAMVREFDIEGQGRFDTGAFIKAWKELHEII